MSRPGWKWTTVKDLKINDEIVLDDPHVSGVIVGYQAHGEGDVVSILIEKDERGMFAKTFFPDQHVWAKEDVELYPSGTWNPQLVAQPREDDPDLP